MATLVSGPWEAPQDKLESLEKTLQQAGSVVKRGGEFARWDLEIQGGLLAGARVLLSVEDLAPGKQLIRFRSWPCFGGWGLGLFGVLALLAAGALTDGAWGVGSVLAIAGAAWIFRTFEEAAYSQSTLLQALRYGNEDREGT